MMSIRKQINWLVSISYEGAIQLTGFYNIPHKPLNLFFQGLLRHIQNSVKQFKWSFCKDSWRDLTVTLHKKWSFPLRISSVNVTNPRKLRIWSHLLKKSVIENFIFLWGFLAKSFTLDFVEYPEYNFD